VNSADARNRLGAPGKRLDLPMARGGAVKSAAALGDEDKQHTLF